MFRLYVTIVRQTVQYMGVTCSVHGHHMFSTWISHVQCRSMGSHIVYIYYVEFQIFR
jgi:hypothetical protein